ncbi:MAG: hypothetical protein ABIJ46_01335 [bacterium]
MTCVFVRLEEGEPGERKTTCLLVSGVGATILLRNPEVFAQKHGNRCQTIGSWVVPDTFTSTTDRSCLKGVLRILLAMDEINATPIVAKLLAAIFEAGVQHALATKTCCRKNGCGGDGNEVILPLSSFPPNQH